MNKREEIYHMTAKEMARLKVAEKLLAGEIKVKDAAEVLMLSTRQTIRIKERVRILGPKAVIHGNRKRKPVNAVASNIKDLVVELKTKKYAGTNFLFFSIEKCTIFQSKTVPLNTKKFYQINPFSLLIFLINIYLYIKLIIVA